MTTIIRKIVPPLNANCYILADEVLKKCLIIDVGGGFDEVVSVVNERGYTVVGALFTHGHYDHALDGIKCKEAGIPVYITRKDQELIDGRGNLARYCGVTMTPFVADGYLQEGINDIGGFSVEVVFTPGHTAGSCCFIVDGTIYSGDTIFKGNFGRFDFPSGSFQDLKKSVFDVVYSYPDKTPIYPGHGDPTTVGEEKEGNSLNAYRNKL